MPSSFVAVGHVAPRSTSRAVTVALAIAAPVESVTRPVRPALTSWARAGARNTISASRIARTFCPTLNAIIQAFAAGTTPDAVELDRFMKLEHIMRLAKARARLGGTRRPRKPSWAG